MRRLGLAVTLVAHAACAPKTLWVDRELSPGDAVVLVLGPLEAPRASIVYADAQGAASLESEEPLRAAIALEQERVLDLRGAPAALDGLRADLEGDLAAACGCSAPALEGGLLRVAPGDRCPLRAGPEDFVDGSVAPETLAARLRVVWPGECGCRAAELATESELTVCPLGEGAERVDALLAAISPDGSATLASRDRYLTVAPDGARAEAPIEPALGELSDLVALPSGGAIAVTNELTSSTSKFDVRFTHLPRAGGSARVLAGLIPPNRRVNARLSPSGREMWIYGEREMKAGPVLDRCALSDDPEQISCRSVALRQGPNCPQLAQDATARAVTELVDGTLAVAVVQGVVFVRGTESVCVPGSDALHTSPPVGSALEIVSLVSVGERLLACAHGEGGAAVVVTATVGAIEGGGRWALEWSRVGELSAGFCDSRPFVEPEGQRAVVSVANRDGVMSYVATRTGTAVAAVPNQGLYPELGGGYVDVATTTRAMVLLSDLGEVWGRRAGEPVMTRRLAFSRPRSGEDARAILPVEGGFRVYTGAASPIEVQGAERCEGVKVHAEPAAYLAPAGDRATAVARLGDRVLVFGVRAGAPVMRVLDADDRELGVVTMPAVVERAAEVLPGAWVAFVSSDGSLRATDGARVETLDAGATWRTVDAAGGVGWAATEAELARLTAGPGGTLALERRVLASADTAEFDGLAREHAARIESLRARCGGRVMLAYSERLSNTLAGEISDVTVWTLESRGAGLAMLRYPELRARTSRPLIPQVVSAIGGTESVPVLVYSGTRPGVGLHAPGVTAAAAPLGRLKGMGARGEELLLGGRDLRLSYVRAR